jgi:surface antigen
MPPVQLGFSGWKSLVVEADPMKKSPLSVLSAAIVFVALSLPAAAFDLRWLSQSPARYFTDEDWKLSQETADKALDTAKDGEAVSWKNPASGNYGSYTPLSTTTEQGMRCREVKIVNHAKNLDASSYMKFCQKPDGKWALVSDALPGE